MVTIKMNVYDIPIVVEQLNKLQQENKKYKEVIGANNAKKME